MDWQPIETAPRDGTPILVWLVKAHLGTRIHVASLRPNISLVGQMFAFDMPEMLLWMPLPPPPAADDGNG